MKQAKEMTPTKDLISSLRLLADGETFSTIGELLYEAADRLESPTEPPKNPRRALKTPGRFFALLGRIRQQEIQ